MAGHTAVNLKAVFGADTSGIEKGAKVAKQSIKDFDSTVQSATGSIAGMFGVDTAAIEKMTSSLRGLGENLKLSANEGVAAFGKMLSSVNGVAAGIAGLGIAGAIASFKLLSAEAENFKNTVAGANIEMASAAYVSTYKQVLHDMNAEGGKAFAELVTNFKERWARGTANVTGTFASLLTGNGPLREDDMAAAAAAAERARDLTNEQFEISRKIAALEVEWASVDADIAEYRRRMKDDSLTLTQRQEAQVLAEQLIKGRYGEELTLRQKLADIQREIVGLSGSSVEDEDKMYGLQKQVQSVRMRETEMLKSMAEEQKSITDQAAKEAEARRKSLEAISGQADKMADMIIGKSILGETDLSISGANGLSAAVQEAFDKALETEPIGLIFKPEIDEQTVKDYTAQIQSLTSSAIESVSDSLGGLIGDLVTGGDAMTNFKDSMLNGFADMAIAVGKIAIAEGVTVSGIKAALESLNPAVAIAAGAALVALGSAVKAGLSNVASGNYSAGSTALSTAGAGVSSGGGYSQSSIKVEVVGRLRASGSDLITVLGNENNRLRETT